MERVKVIPDYSDVEIIFCMKWVEKIPYGVISQNSFHIINF